jgi:transposase-like protein
VKAYLTCPLEVIGARHCRSDQWRNKARFWIDATYLKVRRGRRIVSFAAIIAIGVNTDGRREILGLKIGTSEVEPIWTELPRASSRAAGSGG